MDVSTQIDATNFSSQPTAAAMGQAIPQNHFSPMVGQLRAHSLHPDYLPHSTPTPIPHSTSPTPPPINRGGGSRRQCPRTPHSWRTRSSDLVLTTTLAGGCCMPVNVFSVSMDCWLCGVSVHISTSTPPQIPGPCSFNKEALRGRKTSTTNRGDITGKAT